MQRHMTSLIATCAFVGLTGPVLADCQQELAELRDQAGFEAASGVSKDGSLAPLEETEADTAAEIGDSEDVTDAGSGSAEAETEDRDNEVAKDGSETPLETDTSRVATSGQAAEAQQNDEDAGNLSQEAQQALDRAEAALAAGDEAGCLEALEEARSL